MSELTKQDLADMENRLIEAMRGIESKLLTEFHIWASPVEMRSRSHAAALCAIDVELEAVSDRVTKLERPPA
jgi:hypothetical protein